MFKKRYRYSFKKGLPGNSLASEFFNLRWQKNSQGKPQVAAVVGRKFAKKAVVRNRAKRVFLHALKEVLKGKNLAVDLVFYLKPEIISKNFLEIKNEIEKTLTKIGIIQAHE